MRKTAVYLVALGILVVLVFGAIYIVQTVRQTTEPVALLSQQLGTQVSQVLYPTATIRPDPVTIVREVRSLARLETIQYTVEKVITAESGQGPFGFLFGDRLLLVAHGTVIAGVDLAQVGPEDAWYDELGSLHLSLPQAEILVATLDNDKTYVYDRSTGLFTRGNFTLESDARRAAEEEIERGALEDGILEQAQANAETFIENFLEGIGLEDVILEAASPGLDPTATPSPLPLATPTTSS